ncbi:MAG: hypothetical protein JWM80_3596, partial [Cyanobacteria bacterium RYN_339]|nr:hypothetical protein [Cyanobacteria bacterium RYN_339]
MRRAAGSLVAAALLAACVRSPAATKPKATAPIPVSAGVSASSGGNLVASGGGNVIASGGGNIIGSGGGNVIGSGGGNVIANNGGSLAGDVLAPAGIIANNGGGLVTDNGSGLRLLAVPAQQPLAGVTVRLDAVTDDKGQPIVAKTDAAGHFSFPATPAGHHLVLVVELGKAGSLQAIATKDRGPGAKVDLDLVSTLTTAYILDQYVRSERAVLDKLPADVEAATRAKAGAALAAVPDALTTTQVVAAVTALRGKDKALDDQLEVVRRLLVVGGSASQTDGSALLAALNQPKGMALADDGTLYFADARNNLIRSLSPVGVLTTVAGSGSAANTDGDGLAASLNNPFGLALDGKGGLYVSCTGYVLRKVDLADPKHHVATIVGTGVRGSVDGPGATARLWNPLGLACDRRDPAHPVLYLVDGSVSTVRRVDLADPAYPIKTVAGTGKAGRADGVGVAAAFALPQGAAVAPDGTLYVADSGNHQIRALAPDLTVTTIAGTGTPGAADGPGATASFNVPSGVAYVPGALIVSDLQNHAVRRIDLVDPAHPVTTLAGQPQPGRADGAGAAASFLKPQGIAAGGTTAWVADTFNHLIRKLDLKTAAVTTIAGRAAGANLDGTGTAALFNNPRGLALAADGMIYVADTENHTIRAVTRAGQVTTLAGIGAPGYQDGPGATAAFFMPYSLVLEAGQQGLIVADSFNHRLRRVDLTSHVVTTLAGTGAAGLVNGPGATAAFNTPVGLALDPA